MLVIGNVYCFSMKRNNGLITLDGTCKFDKRLDSQSVRFSSQAEKIVEDSTLVTSGCTSWLSQVEPL